VSRYSDWLKSPKSARVWLEDSMTALGQFAFVNPLHRLKHWHSGKRQMVDCWEEKGNECFLCKKGFQQTHRYTYGLYIQHGDDNIYYFDANLSTHSHYQRIFSTLFDNNSNPCDILFEFTKRIITTPAGIKTKGYDIVETKEKIFTPEVLRPSMSDHFQNKVKDFKWVVPEEIVVKLLDYDGKPMPSLIDFFLLIKDKAPKVPDKEAKAYAVRLLENNVVDLRNAKEFRR